MTTLHHEKDPEISAAIEEAAHAACHVLDQTFPGHDHGGITSNFQGILVDVLTHMLKGRSLLDDQRGHYIALPELVVDDTFFGSPLARGEAFLPIREGDEQWGPLGSAANGGCKPLGPAVLALAPDSGVFRPLAHVGDAWTSFDAAAGAALAFLRAEGLELEQARELGLVVRPVVADPSREQGYLLEETKPRLVA